MQSCLWFLSTHELGLGSHVHVDASNTCLPCKGMGGRPVVGQGRAAAGRGGSMSS